VVFDYLEEFYPDSVEEFRRMMQRHKVNLPRGLTAGLPEAKIEKMVDVALVMAPLWENALGPDWRERMTRERIRELYRRM
jgi:3-deoxy-alpha-D-manno-octulosonate 8-oxidase